MSESWFYLEHVPNVHESAELDLREARHASGSRRLEPGGALTVFDGAGCVAGAIVESVRRSGREVGVRIESRDVAAAPAGGVEVFAAVPKGDRFSAMIGMCTQLGVRAITPLVCERSVAALRDGWQERARRITIEACKQARRAHLPALGEPIGPGECASHDVSCRIVAHQGGVAARAALDGVDGAAVIAAFIGPEGGFTEGELGALTNAGATFVSLGDHVLRIETAAVAMCAVCASR